MIVNFNGKVLTLVDAPAEGDAFIYSPNYDGWIKTFLTETSFYGVTAASQFSKLVGFGSNPNRRSN